MTEKTDPLAIITGYTSYDALNRLKTVKQAKDTSEQATTNYTYDKHGNLTQVTDAEGKVTTYVYDDMGRVVNSVATLLPGGTPPNTVTTRYVYDEAGNLVTKVEGEGTSLERVIQYEYDTANRLTKIDFPTDQDVTFTYDETEFNNISTNGIGRLTTMSDHSGTTRYFYDERGNVVQEKRTIDSTDYAVSYAYNLNNTPTGMTYRTGATNQRVITYSLNNALQRPTSIVSTTGSITVASSIKYEPFGGVSSMSYGNGQEITVTHNQQYQVAELQSGSVLDRDYSYDGMGNITEIDRNSMTDDLVPVYPYSYTDDYSYTKQTAGNILQLVNSDLSRNHAYYSYNIIGDVTVTKQYSIQGELTKELRLTWNEDHRLTEVKDGANQTLATYTYNGLGQRVKKVAGGVTTIFLYDLQGNIISEMRDGTYDDYIYLEGSQRLTKIANSGAIYYYHNDHLGTPIAMTNSSGTVVWKAAYKTFGEAVIDSSSTITNNFRFPGQYYDEETGLHYNYHRYYDPGTGRYVSADPIGLNGGINIFTYVQANPITRVDLNGLSYLIFTRATGSLDVFDGNGNPIYTCPAHNNTVIGKRPFPKGAFPYDYYKGHPESGPTGSFGSHGIYIFKVPGPDMYGMGLHSGGGSGFTTNTKGCIRTTAPCMETLGIIQLFDPITHLIVQ